MPTFGAWEDEVLQHTFEHVEYIWLHTCINDYAQDTAALLAAPDLMDTFIEGVAAMRRTLSSSNGVITWPWALMRSTAPKQRSRDTSGSGYWMRRS